jgi:hypothetical protein
MVRACHDPQSTGFAAMTRVRSCRLEDVRVVVAFRRGDSGLRAASQHSLFAGYCDADEGFCKLIVSVRPVRLHVGVTWSSRVEFHTGSTGPQTYTLGGIDLIASRSIQPTRLSRRMDAASQIDLRFWLVARSAQVLATRRP